MINYKSPTNYYEVDLELTATWDLRKWEPCDCRNNFIMRLSTSIETGHSGKVVAYAFDLKIGFTSKPSTGYFDFRIRNWLESGKVELTWKTT